MVFYNAYKYSFLKWFMEGTICFCNTERGHDSWPTWLMQNSIRLKQKIDLIFAVLNDPKISNSHSPVKYYLLNNHISEKPIVFIGFWF